MVGGGRQQCERIIRSEGHTPQSVVLSFPWSPADCEAVSVWERGRGACGAGGIQKYPGINKPDLCRVVPGVPKPLGSACESGSPLRVFCLFSGLSATSFVQSSSSKLCSSAEAWESC